MIKINSDLFRQNIIDYAITFLGKEYIWGECGPEKFDCSGFTWYIFKQLFNKDINKSGYGEGDTTKQMTSKIGILTKFNVNDLKNKNYLNLIKPGDLLFFHRQSLEDNTPSPTNRYPGHVGIYLGDNEFIHASYDKKEIIISSIDEYWQKILVASKDIISYLKNNKEF